ncbi:hypothetical protein VTJ49DRAFT_5586 [Mycothermus thermophilus]|uniref:CAP-Gly domain-containing protein n=1 Tax=Humicola insolens TaxID=85995 RepID=A0ABR3VLQ1_HUMIN
MSTAELTISREAMLSDGRVGTIRFVGQTEFAPGLAYWQLASKPRLLAAGQQVLLNDGREGTVRFVGQTEFAPGLWIGVELPDGSGKNDGAVQGKRYFTCPPEHGIFVRPAALKLSQEPAVIPALARPQPTSKARALVSLPVWYPGRP